MKKFLILFIMECLMPETGEEHYAVGKIEHYIRVDGLDECNQ